MATVKTIAECLYMLTELIDLAITEQTVKVWEIGLKSFTDEQVQAATHHLIENWESSKNYNKLSPGDLKSIIVRATQSNWSEAWDEILTKAHLHANPIYVAGDNGPRKLPPPEWSSPLVEYAYKQFGGHQAILSMAEKDIPTCRAQFRQIFENATTREATKSTLTLLDGFAQKPFRVLDGGK